MWKSLGDHDVQLSRALLFELELTENIQTTTISTKLTEFLEIPDTIHILPWDTPIVLHTNVMSYPYGLYIPFPWAAHMVYLCRALITPSFYAQVP